MALEVISFITFLKMSIKNDNPIALYLSIIFNFIFNTISQFIRIINIPFFKFIKFHQIILKVSMEQFFLNDLFYQANFSSNLLKLCKKPF